MRIWLASVAALTIISGSAPAQERVRIDQSKNWDVFHKLYPKRALAARQQGLVGFSLTLDRAGHPTECQVTHSSGHKLLDDETCELLMMHAVFKPPKDADGNLVNNFRTGGVINWRIPGAPQTATTAKEVKADPLEKKICKRTPRTGSLAGFERRCYTVREWAKTRDEALGDMDEARRRGWTTCPDGAPC